MAGTSPLAMEIIRVKSSHEWLGVAGGHSQMEDLGPASAGHAKPSAVSVQLLVVGRQHAFVFAGMGDQPIRLVL